MEALSISPPHKYVINHVLNKFTNSPLIETVFLFGSCAKGTADAYSDIDIFVITKDKVHDDRHEAFELLYGATDDIPLDKYISCEILTATKDEFEQDITPLIKRVKSEGVKLSGLL